MTARHATPLPDALALLAPGVEVRTPVQAAQRICAVHDVMVSLSVVAQIQVMESCHVIRAHHPDREAFDAFLREQGVDVVLPPDEAWAMALTHDVQRRHRTVRDVVSTRPAQAMQWVKGFVDVAAEDRLDALDEQDRDLVALLHGPPRRLRQKVRVALAAERGEAPSPPPPAPRPLPDPTVPPPGIAGHVDALHDCVRELERLAAAISRNLPPDHPDHGAAVALARRHRERITLLADLAFNALERIADCARGDDPA